MCIVVVVVDVDVVGFERLKRKMDALHRVLTSTRYPKRSHRDKLLLNGRVMFPISS